MLMAENEKLERFPTTAGDVCGTVHQQVSAQFADK